MKASVLFLVCCISSSLSLAHARQCQIERLTATQLNLNASYLSQGCDFLFGEL